MEYKIGIIGGSGYIGTSLARHLKKDYKIKILDIRDPPNDLKCKIDYTYCDIRNLEETKKNLKDVNLVIHTAIIQIPLINEERRLSYEVNILATQNICEAVHENPNIKAMILTGTWHTIGERDLNGTIDEEFGFRPDKVEDRARLYALSKMAQESVTRFYDEMYEKIYGIIRMGTVLGEGMPEKTAANIFIKQGLRGETITPYKHSMYRPMLYVDIGDICKAFENFIKIILNKEIKKNKDSLAHIVNVYYHEPITILDLANIIKDSIIEITDGEIKPKIEILDKGMSLLFSEDDKLNINVNLNKLIKFLKMNQLKSPYESIREIIKSRLCKKR